MGLLCDLYSLPNFNHAKTVQLFVQAFAKENGQKVIDILNHLYRVCALESLYYKQKLPRSWVVGKSRASLNTNGKSVNADKQAALLNETEEEKKSEDIADPNDRRIKNTRYFRYLLSQTTAFIVPALQGFVKIYS